MLAVTSLADHATSNANGWGKELPCMRQQRCPGLDGAYAMEMIGEKEYLYFLEERD